MRHSNIYIWLLGLILWQQAAAQPSGVQQVPLATPFALELSMADSAWQAGAQVGPFGILEAVPRNGAVHLTAVAYDTGTFVLSQYFTHLAAGPATLVVVPPPADSIQSYRPAMEVLPLLPATTPTEDARPWKHLLWLLPLLLLAWWLWKKLRQPQVLPPIPAPTVDAATLLAHTIQLWQDGQIQAEGLGTGCMQVLYIITGTPTPVTTRGLRQLLRQQQPHLDSDALALLLRQIDAWRFGKQAAQAPAVDKHRQLLEGMIFFTQNRHHAESLP
jgi:hypothetical protein